ncbi:nucleoside/nucleotide kinase family protein [Jannaschia sp. Os4]|uniref:nucleoside/nucleotide kinase family protein n=1 Tax=Jannaschia sp. Os4 TaxID=2807617 RepID=UPI00193A6140|nr:nucleoside/nucleotide kinase family protein [Jannaschia sp. Os4]MBM2577757.1 nucleoside/nucleotide kinase family protein [Jannaschia sp. Os4]
MTPEAVADRIRALPVPEGGRTLTALVGPPASGKSTLSKRIVKALGAEGALVTMDGWHLDDRLLGPMGLRSRKGAPETFDLGGLARTLAAVRAGGVVYLPVFDRAREIAIAGAAVVPAEARHVVVEGNWLLLDEPGWRDLEWNLSVRLDVSEAVLRERLSERWADRADGAAWIEANDLPNARRMVERSRAADVVIG